MSCFVAGREQVVIRGEREVAAESVGEESERVPVVAGSARGARCGVRVSLRRCREREGDRRRGERASGSSRSAREVLVAESIVVER